VVLARLELTAPQNPGRFSWSIPWYSAERSLGTLLSPPKQAGTMHTVRYVRDGDRVFETYWTSVRGVEALDYN
jgi:Bacterial protein of unknown function (DUF899)